MKCFDCGSEMSLTYYDPDQDGHYALYGCEDCGASCDINWRRGATIEGEQNE